MRPRRLARIGGATALMVAAWWPVAGSAGAEPDPPPGPKTVIDHNGTFAVGSDIVAGTYSTPGPPEGKVCYWKRVQGEKILDNNMSRKPQVVKIEPTDTGFRTTDCQPWQLAECPPTCAPPEQPSAGLPDILKGFVPQPKPPAPGAGSG